MPNFPVSWLAKKEDGGDGGLYEASILTLLKPWRTVGDIKEQNQTFQAAFECFLDNASHDTCKTVDNMNFFHKSSKKASENMSQCANDAGERQQTVITIEHGDNDNVGNPLSIDNINFPVSEEDIAMAIDWPFSSCELKYTDDAVGIGVAVGAFAVKDITTFQPQNPIPATAKQFNQF